MNYFIESVDKVKQPFLGTWNNSQQGVTLSLVFCSYFLQLYWISLRTQVWPELCLSACAAWATEVTDPRLQWQDSRSPPPPVLAILIIASFFAIKSSQPQCSQYCLLSLSSSFAYKLLLLLLQLSGNGIIIPPLTCCSRLTGQGGCVKRRKEYFLKVTKRHSMSFPDQGLTRK